MRDGNDNRVERDKAKSPRNMYIRAFHHSAVHKGFKRIKLTRNQVKLVRGLSIMSELPKVQLILNALPSFLNAAIVKGSLFCGRIFTLKWRVFNMEKIDHITVTKYQSRCYILPGTKFIKSVTEQKENNYKFKPSIVRYCDPDER